MRGSFGDKEKYQWRLTLLQELLENGMITQEQFDAKDNENKVRLVTPRITLDPPSSPPMDQANCIPHMEEKFPKSSESDNNPVDGERSKEDINPVVVEGRKEDTTWWFLRGTDQNLAMFDKAMSLSKPPCYCLFLVVGMEDDKFFFIWKLSEGKTVKEWGKWFLEAYRKAIGAPPLNSDSSEEDGEGTEQQGSENGESDNEGNRKREEDKGGDKVELDKDEEGENEGEGDNEEETEESKKESSDSEEDSEDEGGDEIQISEPYFPPPWGRTENKKIGKLWYVGYKVADFDKWTQSQSRAPEGFCCLFYSRTLNKLDEDEEGWLAHTLWRINGKAKAKIFISFSDGLVNDEDNILLLPIEEDKSRGLQ